MRLAGLALPITGLLVFSLNGCGGPGPTLGPNATDAAVALATNGPSTPPTRGPAVSASAAPTAPPVVEESPTVATDPGLTTRGVRRPGSRW
jgi:hypothetical protein